jgi:hypothetical protein
VTLLAAAGLETGAQATALAVASRLWLTLLEAAPGLVLLVIRRPKPQTRNPIAGQHGP